MSKDLELLKVEIFAEYLQSKLDSHRSLIYTAYIGVIIFIYTLMFEQIFSDAILNAIAIFIGGISAIFVSFLYFKNKLEDQQSENLAYIEVLLMLIQEDKELPSLSSLENMDKDSFH